MTLGKQSLHEDRYDPHNLNKAFELSLAAYNITLSTGNLRPSASVMALRQLVNVKIEMSYNPALSANEKWSLLLAARGFINTAFELAMYVLGKELFITVKVQHDPRSLLGPAHIIEEIIARSYADLEI